MAIFKQTVIALMLAGVAACGGKDDGAKSGASKPASEIKVVSAEKAKSAKEAVDIYAVHLGRIADALEAVETQEDAQNAAKVIAEATQEFETLSKKFRDSNNIQLTSAVAMRASELTGPQMRIGVAMHKLAVEHPEFLETISEAMREMPPLQ